MTETGCIQERGKVAGKHRARRTPRIAGSAPSGFASLGIGQAQADQLFASAILHSGCNQATARLQRGPGLQPEQSTTPHHVQARCCIGGHGKNQDGTHCYRRSWPAAAACHFNVSARSLKTRRQSLASSRSVRRLFRCQAPVEPASPRMPFAPLSH